MNRLVLQAHKRVSESNRSQALCISKLRHIYVCLKDAATRIFGQIVAHGFSVAAFSFRGYSRALSFCVRFSCMVEFMRKMSDYAVSFSTRRSGKLPTKTTVNETRFRKQGS